MGLTESKVTGNHGVMILLNDDRETARRSLAAYFRQPIVYFFCALPLLAPSLVLIIVPAVDPRCSRAVLAVGIILFCICVFSFVIGVTLGFLNRWVVRSRKKSLREEKKKLVLVTSNSNNTSGLSTPRTSSSTLSPHNLSASTSSSNLSSRRSNKSRSSSASSAASSGGSQRSGVKNLLTKTDKSTRISLNKSGMRRKKGVKFTVDRLPSLIEEDTVRTVSRGNSQSAFQQDALPQAAPGSGANKRPVGLSSPVSKDNIEELKDYLNVIGLGGGPKRELHPPADTGVNDCRRAKSFDERDLSRNPSRETMRTGPFTSREESNTRKSLTPRPDRAILVTSSHERTGIGMPSMR